MKIHFMPFKANADRRHKFAKAKYKVTNWSKYNESLRRRGDVTVWIEESAAKAWFAPENQRRGRPAKFSELAIETCLQIRVVFGLALRQTQGFVRSVFHLMELVLPVPDFSTLSRRADGLKLSKPKPRTNSEPVALVIDSTGVKIFGAGEWQETKHGTRIKRRTWRKIHLGLDLNTGEIVCSELTEDTVADPAVVPDLLDQVEGPVATFLGDGAYDGFTTRQEIAKRYDGVEIIIPPPKTAIPGPQAATAPTARDRDILAIQKNGRMSWQKQTGYGRRSRGETLMGRFKQVIGTTLRSRKLNNQRTEAKLGVAVLNTMTALGRAAFKKVSA
ncbi:IS5 family transposase [Pseudovibrio sp. Tun.PSC04-5.I4]|uniref:IS5 family transposase n=1 Tax=Pseudovibrio sp. Tun.PSC04-5.I4 TaxID=1798213 RepID=UPI001FCCB2DF|nr:IS5 family transposase [Pseudovibrio sp. Tun.PSC04-5.I4]